MKWHQDRYIAAFRFAAGAHQDQLVPGTRIQYIYHLGLVAMEVIASLVAESGRDEDLAVTVALLHDTLEDTRVTREEARSLVRPAGRRRGRGPHKKGSPRRAYENGRQSRPDTGTAAGNLDGQNGRPHHEPGSAAALGAG